MSDMPQSAPMRVLPHSEEAEKGLLGSILLMPETVLDGCSDRITPAHLFFPTHQTLYSAMLRMHEARLKIDIITLGQFLEDDGQLASVGGRPYITSLYTFVPSAANAGSYIDTIQRKYLRRAIIATSTELIRRSYEENENEHELLDSAQLEVTALMMGADRREVLRHAKEGAYEVLSRFEEAFHHRGQSAIHGLATGIIDFDRMTAGLQPQQLIIVGARPSQGKTALAMNFAANMAVENKVPIAVFSMEMSYYEILERLVCSVAQVSLKVVRLQGFMAQKDFDRMPEEVSKVGNAPLWIDDSPALSIAAFKARARRAVTQCGVKAIVVDYLQLMKSPTRRAQEARWLEITEISAALKNTAKELKIPIICCAQLNREAEGREFGKPKLSDLRESGSIEQDADIVALLWRPERHLENYGQREKLAKKLKLKDANGEALYGDDMSPDDTAERDRQINEYAELIMAKQRNGPVGEIRLRFESDITKFQNVTTKSWSNKQEERQQT